MPRSTLGWTSWSSRSPRKHARAGIVELANAAGRHVAVDARPELAQGLRLLRPCCEEDLVGVDDSCAQRRLSTVPSWRRPSPPAAILPPAGARPRGANAVIDVLQENTSRARSRASRRGGRRATARSKHLEEALPMVPLISWQSISARSAEDLPARQCCGWRRQHERRSWRG